MGGNTFEQNEQMVAVVKRKTKNEGLPKRTQENIGQAVTSPGSVGGKKDIRKGGGVKRVKLAGTALLYQEGK